MSLMGQNVDLLQTSGAWIARLGTLELAVRESGNSWLAYDGQGRTYTFESPASLAGTGVWLLKSIVGEGNSSVLLTYRISNVPTGGGTGTSIDLTEISYNTHPSDESPNVTCIKNEISLTYAAASTIPISLSISNAAVLVRTDTLSQIDVRSRPECRSIPQRLRRYTFQYLPDADTGLPQLTRVSLSGREGTPEAATVIPLAEYGYGTATSNNALRYASAHAITMPAVVSPEIISSTYIDPSVNTAGSGEHYAMWQTLLDVTGDGKPDLIFQKNNKLWLAKGGTTPDGTMTFGAGPAGLAQLSDATLASGPLSTQTMTSARFNYGAAHRNTEDTWRRAIDVNGDGRIDIVDAAEEDNHWVVYLNTPGGPSGVKWERRSYSIQSLREELVREGHNISGNHLPLSRHATGANLYKYQCWQWNGSSWDWYSQGFSNGRCRGKEDYLESLDEETYNEWDFIDVNGDGYPDFVSDSTKADWVFNPPIIPPNGSKPAKGYVLDGEVSAPFAPAKSNDVRVALNVVGVRFDVGANPFANEISLTVKNPELGISRWTCTSAPPTSPCSSPTQFEDVGLEDVNGDGLLDRVIDSNVYLGSYTGTNSMFSSVHISLPNLPATQFPTHFLAAQLSTAAVDCTKFGKRPLPTVRQTQGLRDLTGDGIPDYYEYTAGDKFPSKVWIGTGTGFRSAVPIVSTGAQFEFSHETEYCGGQSSTTDGGLYDLDGDGKAEIVGLSGNQFVVTQLTGGRVPGTPESGRLTTISNGLGATTTIKYESAKKFGDNPLPFPETVVSSIATVGTLNLGGTLTGSSYAYGEGELVFDSSSDRFVFPGYQRQVAMQLSQSPVSPANPAGGELMGSATITDFWPLAPFAVGLTKQQRWLREQQVGHTRDVLTLRAEAAPDPWSLLGVGADDRRVMAKAEFTWDAKYWETVRTAEANPSDCFDMVFPLDYRQTLASLTSDAVNICTAHGFVFQTTTTGWRGDGAPPSDKNVQTQMQVVSVDDFGHSTVTSHQNDVFRTDDDYCVESTYASPAHDFPRILSALSSRRTYLCDKGSTLASESWIYDGLPPGAVSNGHITSHDVDRHATDDGELLNSIHFYDATYNTDGNISTILMLNDSTSRKVTLTYDSFGILPVGAMIEANGVPSMKTTVRYDPISSLPVASIDLNQTQRGIDYDGFGRPVRTTLALPGDKLGVLSTTTYLGFDGVGPVGPRITMTQFQDPLDPTKILTALGRSATIFRDELGRTRRIEVAHVERDFGQTLVVGSSLYDGAGRLAFIAEPFQKGLPIRTPYGLSYFYNNDGDIDCIVRGYGYKGLASRTTDLSTEQFPTCFQRSFAGHVDTLDVRDSSSLQLSSPQAGVVHREVKTAIGWPIERSTLKNNMRLEQETFAYDPFGQWTSIRRFLDPANTRGAVIWSSRRDSLHQLLELDEPETAKRTYRYDTRGNTVETDWMDGTTHRAIIRGYDSLNRLLGTAEQNNGTVDPSTINTFSYDNAINASPLVKPTYVLGQLAGATWSSGSMAYSYDALGRVTARVSTDQRGQTYVDRSDYHVDGSLSSVGYNLPDDGYALELAKYTYDLNGQLREVNFADSTGNRQLYNARDVDIFGRVTDAAFAGTTNFHADYAPDGRRLIKETSLQSPNGSRRLIFGQFDPAGREQSRQEVSNNSAEGSNSTVFYDAMGRVAGSIQTGNAAAKSSWNFNYDALGNITTLSNSPGVAGAALGYEATDKDRICRIGYAESKFGFVAEWGSLLPSSLKICNVSYDAMGSIVKEPVRNGTRKFSYFSSGNVRTITQGNKHASFTYNGFGQLQSSDVQSGTTTHRHDEHFGDLIERHEETSAAGNTSFITRNIPGPNGIVASRRGFTNDWVYPFGERRGNRFSTNQDGSFLQSLTYQPFGETQSSGSTPGSPDYTSSQWNGGDALQDFGLSHLGVRIYDPVIGRFLSRDPLLNPRTASSTNPYAFASNDPINLSDPSGADVGDCSAEQCQGGVPFTSWGADFGFGGPVSRANGPNVSASFRNAQNIASTPSRAQVLEAGVREAASDEDLEIPLNTDFHALSDKGFRVREVMTNLRAQPDDVAGIDSWNASMDRIGHWSRVVGVSLLVGDVLLGTGGAAFSVFGGATTATATVTATGVAGAAAVGGAVVVAEPEIETGIEEGAEFFSAETSVGGGVSSPIQYVVRGGLPNSIPTGTGVTTTADGMLSGVSVQSAPGASINELAASLFRSYGKISWTTLNRILSEGGTLVEAPSLKNPWHCEVCDITFDRLSGILNVIPNPSK